jgi:DNA-binding MarR family transcriptional regulator
MLFKTIMASPRENPDPLAHPQRVTDLLLYRLSAITRSTSLPLVRIFEGEFGITRRHWHLLAVLVEQGAMPSARLATLCWLDRPRISRAVSGLRQKGLVAPAAGAGRARDLVVTDAGRQLYARAMQRVTAFNTELVRTLSAAERTQLDTMLRRLQERAATLADEVARTAPSAARHKGRRGSL